MGQKPGQPVSQTFVAVEAVPGLGLGKGLNRWMARAHHGDNGDPHRIEIRAWLRFLVWLPFLGMKIVRRILRHELEHLLCDDFKRERDHHDSPFWHSPHFCGRSFSWRGFLSERHLRVPRKDAEFAVQLFLKGARAGAVFAHPFHEVQ